MLVFLEVGLSGGGGTMHTTHGPRIFSQYWGAACHHTRTLPQAWRGHSGDPCLLQAIHQPCIPLAASLMVPAGLHFCCEASTCNANLAILQNWLASDARRDLSGEDGGRNTHDNSRLRMST